ncbi:MAG TPA: ABC transporter ATP-binding protein [Mycobacteriales bacterium]|nr:ABC transporter ATP-binding protein [Mycobacteriales bacterium]
MSELLLDAQDLRAAYTDARGRSVVAVDDVSLQIREGEVLGIAGESGCGKSTLASVLSLTARPPLRVLKGTLQVAGKAMDLGGSTQPPREWRGTVVSLLPQGAMNSLSPTLRIRDFAFDIMRAHRKGIKRKEALQIAGDRLTGLGLPERVLAAYPHQLSGGMKQRVVTILSTLLDPSLLIADEPTSALDVSSQRVLVEMLREMVARKIISGVIFVTHDLPVLSSIADRLAIMYAGELVEVGPTRQIIDAPRHPYSAALLQSVLVPEPQVRRRRIPGIPGAPPNLLTPPSGCRFHPRCRLASDRCRESVPPPVISPQSVAHCWWAKDHPDQSVPMEEVGSA